MQKEYKEAWREFYGEYPYTETDRDGMGPEKFAVSMLKIFELSGILDLMKNEKVSILASSVSTGKKDWEFLKQLDARLGTFGKFKRPQVFLTDFALTKEGKSVVKQPGERYQNLDYHIVASDTYHLPFKDALFQVLYERLGALYHAADEDIMKYTGGTLTRKMLDEYKRVVIPGGKVIIDWIDSSKSYSTAQRIDEAVWKDLEVFFKDLGFGVEFVGESEGFIILTNPGVQKLESIEKAA